MFKVDEKDLNETGNGDIVIRTNKGTLVALIYAAQSREKTLEGAKVIVEALNKIYYPNN